MHAQRELNRLAGQKLLLRRRIAARRQECAESLATVLRPLGWLDAARSRWERVPPTARIAALPLALLLKQVFFPKVRVLGAVLRWAPLVAGIFRPGR